MTVVPWLKFNWGVVPEGQSWNVRVFSSGPTAPPLDQNPKDAKFRFKTPLPTEQNPVGRGYWIPRKVWHEFMSTHRFQFNLLGLDYFACIFRHRHKFLPKNNSTQNCWQWMGSQYCLSGHKLWPSHRFLLWYWCVSGRKWPFTEVTSWTETVDWIRLLDPPLHSHSGPVKALPPLMSRQSWFQNSKQSADVISFPNLCTGSVKKRRHQTAFAAGCFVGVLHGAKAANCKLPKRTHTSSSVKKWSRTQ